MPEKFLDSTKRLFVIIGPSGTGKSSAVQRLAKEGIVTVTPTWTSRPPRPAEKDEAIEHTFVTESEFTQKESAGYFLQTVTLFGLPYRYGMPRVLSPSKDSVPLVMLRAPLIQALEKFYPNLVIYQIEDSIEHVKKRLAIRQENGEPVGTRLDDFHKEITLGASLASRIFVNDDLDKLVSSLKRAIGEDFNK